MIQRYLAEILPERRKDDRANLRHMLAFFDEQLGHLTLAELNAARVAEAKSELQKRPNKFGKPFAPATIYAYLSAFSGVCKIAVKEWRLMPKNPVDDISYLAMSGATVRELVEALGHQTLSMAMRYSHLMPDHNRTLVSRMAERFLD